MKKNQKNHAKTGVLMAIIAVLVMAASVVLGYGTAGAVTNSVQANVPNVTTVFSSFCEANQSTNVYATVSGLSTDGSIEYYVNFNTPTHGIVSGTVNSAPYGTTILMGVDTISPGTYTYSGVITDSLGNSWHIQPTQVNAVDCSRPTTPYVGIAPTPDGQGYWAVTTGGNVYGFNTAVWYGGLGGTHINQPIVGMASTLDGHGYWLVAADGGIFSFGDATFYGSTGNIHLNKPIVGMTASPDGGGYYFVASDGGVFCFGDAHFQGSMGANHLNQPVVGTINYASLPRLRGRLTLRR